MTMSDNAVDSACMSDSSDDSYDGLESATMGLESLTRSVPQYPKSSE